MNTDKGQEFFDLIDKGIDPLEHILKKRRDKRKAFLEREIVVKKAGDKGWSVSDNDVQLSCHATSQDSLSEAFRLSQMRNPPIKIVVDCTGEEDGRI